MACSVRYVEGAVNTPCLICLGPTGRSYLLANNVAICGSCAEAVAKAVSGHRGATVYECDECGEEFGSRQALAAHKRHCRSGKGGGRR